MQTGSSFWREAGLLVDRRGPPGYDADWSRIPAVAAEAGGTAHALTGYERYGKPAFDRFAATVLLVVITPVLIIVAIAIVINLGAPVLLRQQRIGKGGKSFAMYKFRTMLPDRRQSLSEAVSVQGERRISHKRSDDPRLVPLGRFLRRWSLDELPQLLNVIRGQMSLVGPRPELESIVRRYEPWQHARHEVKPGMTGWWQITGRGSGLMHEHTDVDLEYVRGVSLRADLKILLLTLPAAMGRCRGI